jgi:septum formation protein
MAEKKKAEIILASASPRRKLLLEKAGYKFRVSPPDVDEEAFETDIDSVEYAKKLALEKAKNVAARFPDAIVIGSDTVVDFEGEIIGKAADAAHAEEITRKLFSRPHKVITGVAIIRQSKGIEILESDTTTVYPKSLTEKQIQGHIEGGLWEGKAGAYGIQETGDEFVERIEGSLTNVMGFPMELVERLLARLI